MTIKSYEVTVVSCDECGDEEESHFNPDFENVTESEMYWFESLKDKGWIYDKENDEHYCPECVKELNIE